jgi:peptidyl-prolyl isomerase G (cyclophilin G)
MTDSAQKRSQDEKTSLCFFRISIGGEILAKDIVIELDIQNRPKTCDSFLSLCDGAGSKNSSIRTNRKSPQLTYRGCEFHRVVPGLCVQAGDWERFDGTGGFSPMFGRNWEDEKGASSGKYNTNKHDREGIVSMANAGKPNTNGSQFFVTLKPTPHLDGKHTVFGRVASGMESVRKMAEVERGEKDRPVSLQRIVIEDCGRLSLEQKQNPKENDVEVSDQRQSRPKKHKKKKRSKKRERKKRDKKRSRYHHDYSSGTESYCSDDSSDVDSGSEEEVVHRRERRSKKHRKRKRRRKTYDKHYSSDGDESSGSNTYDGKRRKDRKQKRRQSSGDENDRGDKKKRKHDKKRR